jgi:hypothetical protein
MRKLLIISFPLILTLFFSGCKKVEKKERKPVVKENEIVQREFGKWNKHNDSLGVELNIEQFNNWSELVERADQIVCNDSIPKITLNTNNEIKTIYFYNDCWEVDPHIIKSKNVIEILNDTIFKPNLKSFPLDSLESVLENDINNNGLNPKLSENSNKLVISISYDKKNNFDRLHQNLDELTEQYYKITNSTEIKVWLTDKEFLKPPKPFKK